MTKVADSRPMRKNREAKDVTTSAPGVPKRSRPTAAQRLIQNSRGWTGDDLEEVIQIVLETRSRSRF